MFNLERKKIIISFPQITEVPSEYLEHKIANVNEKKIFFFPTFPRPFKNIEVICKAAELLVKRDVNFEVIITVDGSENNYSRSVVNNYKNNTNINFIGLIKREEVYQYYAKSDCLIFPSKLETWGLPISEFKQFGKPMLVADLPYARETVGLYDYVNFFKEDNASQLAQLMYNLLNNESTFDNTSEIKYEDPFVQDWSELFQTLLK